MKHLFLLLIILRTTYIFTFANNEQTSLIVQLTSSKKAPYNAYVSTECSICLEKLYRLDCHKKIQLRWLTHLQCGHMFHLHCANGHRIAKRKLNSLYKSYEPLSCPLCNQEFLRVHCVGQNKAIIIAAIKILHDQEEDSSLKPFV